MLTLVEHLQSRGFPLKVIEQAQAEGPNLVSGLWSLKEIDEAKLLEALGSFFDLPVQNRLEEELSTRQLRLVPLTYLKSHRAVPLSLKGDTLPLAVADPLDLPVLSDLSILFDAPRLEVRLAPPRAVAAAVNRLYERATAATGEAIQEIDDEAAGLSLEALDKIEDLMDATTDAPAVRLVNLLLVEAVKRRSSDVHIEPYRDAFKVRYRIDGLLYDVHSPPLGLAPAISSRIKVMSDLDIAERRLPQDGRFPIKVADQEIDVRVSVVPTAFGERIVLRLLNKSDSLMDLTELGMAPDILKRLDQLISRTSGIILVTGPTGSGKTTTLYAALKAINTPEKNIITVEDPIEYQIAGVGQMQINPKIGLTFARALRSILRHDPDVIMVGEIRDVETAQIAIHASQTGHLVFSTLHTNDAAGAVTRLIDMGIEPFLIASSLSAVLAQRLVRRVCPHCRREAEYPAPLLAELGLEPQDGPFFEGPGCGECFQAGHWGRFGIYELLIVDEPIRELILSRAASGRVQAEAVRSGMKSLLADGALKVKKGQTTPDEVLRVVHG